MKRNSIVIGAICLGIMSLIGSIFFLKDMHIDLSEKKSSKNGSTENISAGKEETTEAKTVTYSNDDFVYIPSNDDIGYDSEVEIYFYEHLLNIYLASDLSNEEAEALAETVDGTVAGKIQGAINMLQLQVDASSIAELNRLADHLEDNDRVAFAESSTPSFISNLKDNDAEVSDDIDRDWWAKAIHAHEAWDFIDDNENGMYADVTVGVLETNKLGEHEDEEKQHLDDIRDSFNVKLSDITSKFKDKKGNVINHPRWVTKFIAADPNKNSVNFRGVANGVADVNFTSIGDDYEALKSGVPEPYIMSLISFNIDEGAKIINNSWGFQLKSKKNWKDDSFFKRTGLTYNDYLNEIEKSNDKVSAQLIVALDRLLSAKNVDSSDSSAHDFLIIQGAGNGKSRLEKEKWSAETTTKARHTGFFANINQETYEKATDLIKDEEMKLDNKLNDILDHIMIVGGAEKKNKESYQSPEWASYGNAIDIVAPAADLFTDIEGDKKNGIRGTSFAAPMVSGAAALLWSYDLEMSAGEIKHFLLNNAEKDVEDNEKIKDDHYEKQSYPMLNIASPFYSYDQLIEIYRTAIRDNWSQSQLDEEDLGPVHYEPQSLSDHYGFAFKDINGNGSPELLLGESTEDGDPYIDEIYSLQNKKPVKVFQSAIRRNINVYQDGTIETDEITSPGRGIQANTFFQLNDKGAVKWEDGYEQYLREESSYNRLTKSGGSDGAMTETDVNKLKSECSDAGMIELVFTPFVLDEKAHETETTDLTDDEMKEIVRENYRNLEEILLEKPINQLYNHYYEQADGQKILESGVDPNSSFYEDVHALLYPEVKDIVAEEGMESLINEKYSMFWQPPAPISFYGPSYDLEVLSKNSERFKVKQTKEMGPQDKGGTVYDLEYSVEYVKEGNRWKFAGANKQE